MPNFSKTSKSRLETCHKDLQKLFNEVVREYDCSIIEGYREEKRQLQLYKDGKSKVKKGKHNFFPSLATDVSPYPIPLKWGAEDKKELVKFYHFAGYVKAKAEELGIKIRWGGDWNSNNEFNDQTFDDLVHYELVEPISRTKKP